MMPRAQIPAAFAYADPKLGARRLQAAAEQAAANFLLKEGIAETLKRPWNSLVGRN